MALLAQDAETETDVSTFVGRGGLVAVLDGHAPRTVVSPASKCCLWFFGVSQFEPIDVERMGDGAQKESSRSQAVNQAETIRHVLLERLPSKRKAPRAKQSRIIEGESMQIGAG